MLIKLLRNNVVVAKFYSKERLEQYIADDLGVHDTGTLDRLGFSIKTIRL